MLIDLKKFIEAEQPRWKELEAILDHIQAHPAEAMAMEKIERFHYLYERVSADLARISSLSLERDTHVYLESLVARAYGEIQETRSKPHRLSPLSWFFATLPSTFRMHIKAFYLASACMLAGILAGSLFLALDPSSKEILLPMEHLAQSPSERVKQEEGVQSDRLKGVKTQGAAWYMTHNTQVSLVTMAMGATYGAGTCILLFVNGIMLGVVCTDYVMAGQTKFLAGWLLPHGAVEIPALLLAGQAGLMLAGALIGSGRRKSLKLRLREIAADLVTIALGSAILLVWAGIIEAFLSQYHEPVLPYSFKIALGLVELMLVVIFFARFGRSRAAAGDEILPAKPGPRKVHAATERG